MEPERLLYLSSHEWIEPSGDERRMGISDHAQRMLGDIVYLELPKVGTQIKQGDELLTIESPKAAASVYAPVSGEVVAVNEDLDAAPERVNESPYGEGWFVKIRPSNWDEEKQQLLDVTAYNASLEEE